jgi:hypothetical protein
MWLLPTAATRARTWTSRVIALQAGILAAIYQLPQTPTGKTLDGDLRFVLTRVAPVALVVAFVVAFVLETAPSRPRGRLRVARDGLRSRRSRDVAPA